jgi:hypothetical protein
MLSNRLTKPTGEERKREFFYVIHPLDDVPEEKVKSDHLPPLKMTPSFWWSLFALRAYLIIMLVLLIYRLVDLARA